MLIKKYKIYKDHRFKRATLITYTRCAGCRIYHIYKPTCESSKLISICDKINSNLHYFSIDNNKCYKYVI